MFPVFSTVADNNETYDNSRMSGSAYIVVFSAEWCNSPCYTTMHAIWAAKAELPVLVMSTDPAENAGSMTLSDWHESANAHDDEGDDTGVELTTYAFMKGSEVATSLDITDPVRLRLLTQKVRSPTCMKAEWMTPKRFSSDGTKPVVSLDDDKLGDYSTDSASATTASMSLSTLNNFSTVVASSALLMMYVPMTTRRSQSGFL